MGVTVVPVRVRLGDGDDRNADRIGALPSSSLVLVSCTWSDWRGLLRKLGAKETTVFLLAMGLLSGCLCIALVGDTMFSNDDS